MQSILVLRLLKAMKYDSITGTQPPVEKDDAKGIEYRSFVL